MLRNKKLACIMAAVILASLSCSAYIIHEVKRSETLWGLAHANGVKPDDIIAANPEVAQGLKAGMKIRIPEPQDLKALNESASLPNEKDEVAPVPNLEGPEEEAQETSTETIDYSNQMVGNTEIDEGIETNEVEEEESEEEDDEYLMMENPNEHNVSIKTDDAKTYISRFGDTLASIAFKTGMTEPELMVLNPLVSDGTLSEGTVVRLTDDAPYINNSQYLTIIDSITSRVIPPELHNAIKTDNVRTIAVMLPFDADGDVLSKHAVLATDFYKGFLMAVQKNTQSSDIPLRIIAVDTSCDKETFEHRLQSLADENVSIIIPPDDETQLEKIEEYALENNIVVLNTLNVKDEGYLRYPNVIQGNISQKRMYDKAIAALMDQYGEYIPIILDIKGTKDEKISFIDDLKKQYSDRGMPVVTLTVNDRLEEADLANLNSDKKYIFIPKSGSADVFYRIYDTLLKVKEDDAFTNRFHVFGYPDWIVFTGETADALHRMGATIYSRFYMDKDSREVEEFNDEFQRWYGAPMEEAFPMQGILGYDTGNLLFRALNKTWIENDINKFENGRYNGQQSIFYLVKDNDTSGLVNDSLFLVDFLRGDFFTARKL